VAAVVLAMVGPGIAILFPIWLAGVLAYRWRGRAPWWLAGIGFGGAAVVAFIGHRHGQIYDAFELSAARMTDFAKDYGVGLAFALGLVGVTGGRMPTILRIGRPVRWLAGATFALYLFHLPLIRFAVAVSPWPASAWGTRGMVLVGVPVAVLLLAELTERRKAAWRNGLRRLVPAVVR
jgi:peptidoglycan/LPS O-acetylase OafA/YrhL